MSLLRFVALLSLVLWIGGLAAIGLLGAPVIFGTIQAHDPVAGRELAAVVFGALFARAQHASWVCGGVLILTFVGRAALGPRPRRFAVRLSVVILLLIASLASALLIAPRIDAITRNVSGSIASLPDTDPRRVEFGRLHGLANGLMLLTLAAGVGLIWAETKDPQ